MYNHLKDQENVIKQLPITLLSDVSHVTLINNKI